MKIRWSRIGLGFGLVIVGVVWLWIDAVLGIKTTEHAGLQPAFTGTPYALGAPPSGAQSAGPLRVGVDWPARAMLGSLAPAPAGQSYVLVHLRARLEASARGPATLRPDSFTVRDGRGLAAHPLAPPPAGLSGVLGTTTLRPGEPVDGVLLYLVPRVHGPLGLVATLRGAPHGHLLWSVPS